MKDKTEEAANNQLYKEIKVQKTTIYIVREKTYYPLNMNRRYR